MISRILIAGSPRTGKTTLAARLQEAMGIRAMHTDDAAHLGWSEASAEVARWMEVDGPLLVEGVAAPRACRKWLAAHPEGAPCDMLIVLTAAMAEQTPGQIAMGKGVMTVLEEIRAELVHRGVEIVEGEAPAFADDVSQR